MVDFRTELSLKSVSLVIEKSRNELQDFDDDITKKVQVDVHLYGNSV